MSAAPIRVLMVEDNPLDAELIQRELRRANLEYISTRVDSELGLRAAIQSFSPDIILGDYNLPGFDGVAALRIARTLCPDTPFIFVSGSIGEERAIQALREGASDYILKDRPSRLASAVTRALEEQRERELRKSAQSALQRSEERFQLAAKATQEVIWDWDVITGRISFNEALAKVWDWVLFEDTVPVEWWKQQIHPEDRPRVLASLDAAMENDDRWVAEYRFQRGTGLYGHVLDRALIVRDADGKAVRLICAMVDVTDRVAAEIMIEGLSRQNEMIVKFAGEGIIAVDADVVPLLVNPAAATLLEATVQELQASTDLHALHHHTRADGTPYPVTDCPTHKTLVDGVVRSGEDVYWRRSGQSFPVEYSVSPMRDEGERIVGAVVVFQDITKRKRLEKQLEQADRVSSLGRVVATIAHEFNNVLMGIQPFAEVIRGKAGDEKLQNAATQIISSVARGRRVTQGVLRYTQPAEPSLQAVEVGPWLHRLAPELHGLLGSRIRLKIAPGRSDLACRCDASQLQQVITNLVINARDAMSGEGNITIEMSDASDRRQYPFGPIPDDMILIAISDSGSGMSPDVLANIFVPLFTTKKAGTGLGLAVAQQIVTRHGGSIHVTSALGQGTTFYVLLPATEMDAVAAETTVSRHRIRVRRVLIVDDDPVVSAGISALLEAEGVAVRAAETGATGIATAASFDPDAVILDWSLPDMDGGEVFHQLHLRSPRLPVIFSTGHADETVLEKYVQTPHVTSLRKPYEMQALFDALERITAPDDVPA